MPLKDTGTDTTPFTLPLQTDRRKNADDGFYGRLKYVLKHNVPRAVGGSKFAADSLLGFGGSPIMIGVSACYLMARTTLMLFGGTSVKSEEPEKTMWSRLVDKTVPSFVKKQPLEFASILGTIAAAGFVLEGILHNQPASVATGIIAGVGETIIWAFPYFGTRRDIFQEAADPQEQSLWYKCKRSCRNLKDQPVRLGSMLLALSSVTVLINGVLTGNIAQIAAGLLYIGANIAQGLFVDKNLTGLEMTLPDSSPAMPDFQTSVVTRRPGVLTAVCADNERLAALQNKTRAAP